MIADLSSLGLTEEQRARRRLGLGGSDAVKLMSGDPAKVMQLWETKVGLRADDDLSDMLHVMLGHWTEPFNAAWYQKTTGNKVVERNISIVNGDMPWCRANLDGIAVWPDDWRNGVWEAKHVAGREPIRDVVRRYTPQVYHNMQAAGLGRGVLSILEGTSELRVFDFEADPEYERELIERERAFWECVELQIPPPEWLDIAPPPPVTDFRAVDMHGDRVWCEAATIWLETRGSARRFDDISRSIKDMIERDVGEAKGHGIVVSRSKNGALTIREAK